MKLIKHMIVVDMDDRQKLLIHGLDGRMDLVEKDSFDIISGWKDVDPIIPANSIEQKLYNYLKETGYLIIDSETEEKKRQSLMETLRKKHLKKKDVIEHITFVVTYDCNFRCPYCYEKDNETPTDVISKDMIDQALQLAGDNLKSIGLFGGEPLLPKNRESLEYLVSKTRHLQYNIITNGYYLESYVDLFKNIDLLPVQITLDGNKNTHDRRRILPNGEGTYDKIIKGMELFLSNQMPIRVRMNLDKNTLEEGLALRSQLQEQFKKYDAYLSFELSPLFQLKPTVKNEINQAIYEADLPLSPVEREQNNRLAGTFSPLVSHITQQKLIHPLYKFCYAHGDILVLDPLGQIYPCILAVGIPELASGSYYPTYQIKENSIINRNIESIPECQECIYAFLCGGGCPLGLEDYNDFNKPQCYSIYNEIHMILPEILQAEAFAKAGEK